jgi:hypothetical protein
MAESQGYLAEKPKTFVPVTSADQWTAIEDILKHYYFSIRFRIGETIIDVRRLQVREGRTKLFVYIDGKIDVRKSQKDKETGLFDPMVMRVWRRQEIFLVSKQRQSNLLTKWKAARVSKKEIEELKKIAGFDRSFIMYTPEFSAASSLARQFRKIEGIEVEW